MFRKAIVIAGLVPCISFISACGKQPESTSSPQVSTEVPAVHESSTTMAADDHPDQVLFGETHIHTAYSLDAYLGGTRLTPSDAYQFAKGAQVSVNGVDHQLHRPLDFTVVTDHAEYLGEMYSTMVEGALGYDDETIAELRSLTELAERRQWFARYVVENNRSANPQHPDFFQGFDTTRSAWQLAVEAAEQHNEAGVFTALIGFEWSGTRDGGNLHRNVVFRDSIVPDMPTSSYESRTEVALWDWMAEQESNGSTVLAIPHNSNASKLHMFNGISPEGKPIDQAYAEMRNRFEPLIEMMQVKGNSEVHRNFWPADEFADFENGDSIASFSGRELDKRNFVRWGITQGLTYQQELGINPFEYGFIGGSDSHNGTPTNGEEDNFIGGHGMEDNTALIRQSGEVGGWISAQDESITSLAAVWARENTRGEIFDAMQRRESYATSGTRIKLRFFGGAGLASTASSPEQMVEEGYAKGVPMGGTLTASADTPVFTMWAQKDPDGANLDRIQIIKGWLDENSEPKDVVIDVAWNDSRVIGNDGKLPSVGNTVNPETAQYTNSIGASELIGVWQDPDFDQQQGAVYYVRVLEIPTPRWSTYDAVRNGLPLPNNVAITIQERAWSSPIWVLP